MGRTPVSLAIFAWNEEDSIASTLESLFAQSLFEEIGRRGERCEVICVLNGCTDSTAAVANRCFETFRKNLPSASHVECRVADIRERGKLNAWNQYVHKVSAPEAAVLFMMDADILIHIRETLWNMLLTLEKDPEANVAVDQPCKDISFNGKRTVGGRISLGMSSLTSAAPAQLCGQLYCIRAETARKIYLPKDLSACEDGFIKALVCTDLLTRPVQPKRIRQAANAGHTFEAYTSPKAILKNQKRQIIGQTIVHLLVDHHLKHLPLAERLNLAETLRNKEAQDPAWLKKLIAAHVRKARFFWRLHPGVLGQRFKHLRQLSFKRRMACLPAATAGAAASSIAAFMAWRALKTGSINYWPRAERTGRKPLTESGIADGQPRTDAPSASAVRAEAGTPSFRETFSTVTQPFPLTPQQPEIKL